MEIGACAIETTNASGDAEHLNIKYKLTESGLDKRASDKLNGICGYGESVPSAEVSDDGLADLIQSLSISSVDKNHDGLKQTGDAPLEKHKPPKNGPDQEKLNAILDRTGFMIEVTKGQRKYCKASSKEQTISSQQFHLFCGKIPKDVFEDTLIPLFEPFGKIVELRLMIDPITQESRGFGFIVYDESSAVTNAIAALDDYEIKPNHPIKLTQNQPNYRLYIGNIPKSKDKQELYSAFSNILSGLIDVIIYHSPDDRFHKNRGFCFLQFCSHQAAAGSKRKLSTTHKNIWGCDLFVDWADPQSEPDDSVMKDIKVLYVRNLKQSITEDRLKDLFEQYGPVERVKKIKDFAFVHFAVRGDAIIAMNALNGFALDYEIIQVSLSRPPLDKEKKEELLRARERRMLYNQLYDQHKGPMPTGVSEMNCKSYGVSSCDKCHCCSVAYSKGNSFSNSRTYSIGSKYKIK